METITRDAAKQLGVTQRQVQRLALMGRLVSRDIAGRRVVASRSLVAASRSAGRGRSWEAHTVTAACELLLTGTTHRVAGSQLSRLRSRLRTISISDLAYQVLSDRVTLWRSTRANGAVRADASDGLSATGQRLEVKVTQDAGAFARRAHLLADADGDTLVVELDLDATLVVENLALYAYGDERTSIVARQRIERLQSAL